MWLDMYTQGTPIGSPFNYGFGWEQNQTRQKQSASNFRDKGRLPSTRQERRATVAARSQRCRVCAGLLRSNLPPTVGQTAQPTSNLFFEGPCVLFATTKKTRPTEAGAGTERNNKKKFSTETTNYSPNTNESHGTKNGMSSE